MFGILLCLEGARRDGTNYQTRCVFGRIGLLVLYLLFILAPMVEHIIEQLLTLVDIVLYGLEHSLLLLKLLVELLLSQVIEV